MARHEPEPVRITTASRSHHADVAIRQRRYLISMGIRTVCFLWLFITGSLLLPYVAVILANAGASPDPGGPARFDPDPQHRAIEGGPDT